MAKVQILKTAILRNNNEMKCQSQSYYISHCMQIIMKQKVTLKKNKHATNQTETDQKNGTIVNRRERALHRSLKRQTCAQNANSCTLKIALNRNKTDTGKIADFSWDYTRWKYISLAPCMHQPPGGVKNRI